MATIERPAPARAARAQADDRGDQLLFWAAAFFTAAVLVHGADHVRRGADAVSVDVFWTGTAAIAIEVAVVVLVCQRHRLAPVMAAATGVTLALGYLTVHFLPERSWLSDSFTSAADVSPLSWVAASLEVVAAIALGVFGLVVLRRRGGLESASRVHPGERSLRDGLAHPVALAMIVGNAAILAVSLPQLFG